MIKTDNSDLDVIHTTFLENKLGFSLRTSEIAVPLENTKYQDMPVNDLKQMSNKDLKDIARVYGRHTSGNKPNLVEEILKGPKYDDEKALYWTQ